MDRMKRCAFLAAWGTALMLVFSGVSGAQNAPQSAPRSPSTESVIVTGKKQGAEDVIRGFVKSYAAPAPALGKMAKWARGMCPAVIGLPPAFNSLVTKRVREVAVMVGAPLLPESSCKPNVDIVFTRQPQLLLDGIRKDHSVLLGYHYMAQAETVAAVRYPIQAWYVTETEDEHGLRQIDNPQDRHGSDMIIPPGNPACPHGCTWHFPTARTENVTASRIADSLRSQFFHVMVVIDLDKISGLEIGSLADDIASLALAQPQVFDACLIPPSITNLMTPGCAAKPKSITDMDLAYLRSLYRVSTDISFAQQKDQITYQMTRALAGN